MVFTYQNSSKNKHRQALAKVLELSVCLKAPGDTNQTSTQVLSWDSDLGHPRDSLPSLNVAGAAACLLYCSLAPGPVPQAA